MVVAEFLNRTASLQEVDRFLAAAAAADWSRVLCVTGPQGCGKSELLRQASSRRDRWALVTVDRGELDDGSPPAPVWASLAEAIDRQAVADGFPPRRTAWSEGQRKGKAAAGLAVAVAARFFRPLAALKELGDRAGELSEAFAATDPDKAYVKQALDKVPCAIHVDHADRCGDEDWRFLSLLLATTGCVLLVEGGMGFAPPATLQARELRLAPLEESFASILFDGLPAGLGRSLREPFAATGDLKPYAALARRSGRMTSGDAGPPFATGDSLRIYSSRAVAGLLPDDRTALLALAAHLGEAITLGVLRRFLASSAGIPAPTTDVVASLRRLEDAVLAVSTSEGYRVPGTVLGVLLDDAASRTERLVRLRDWRDFYLDPARCGLPLADRRRCLQVLRQCVPLRDVVGISSTLEAVGVASPGADVRTDMATFARWLASQFDPATEPIVADACARYLYGAGWFADARDVLSAAGEPASRRARYFLAELYCTAGPRERGLRIVEHERAALGPAGDPDSELCLELVELHGLRNSDRFGDARRRFNAAMLVQRYKACRAYPVLLRSADFCLMLDEDLEACCILLEEAARLSTERRDWQEAASAYVALCQQHGYHDLSKARSFLAEAARIARSSWVEMPAVLANGAVLSLYEGTVAPEGLASLEDALVLTTDPDDEVLVRLNLLVHRMLAGDGSGSGIPELEALLAGTVRDTEIARIVHFNLERASLDLCREADARRHGAAWRGAKGPIDAAYWESRKSGARRAGVPAWRLDLPYYPVLLSHWKLGAVPFDAVPDQG